MPFQGSYSTCNTGAWCSPQQMPACAGAAAGTLTHPPGPPAVLVMHQHTGTLPACTHTPCTHGASSNHYRGQTGAAQVMYACACQQPPAGRHSSTCIHASDEEKHPHGSVATPAQCKWQPGCSQGGRCWQPLTHFQGKGGCRQHLPPRQLATRTPVFTGRRPLERLVNQGG
jgi:hypothetical protein